MDAELALEACVLVARMIRAFDKDKDDQKSLGSLTIDLEGIRLWVRGLSEDRANQLFSDPVALRDALGHEPWSFH